MPLNQVTAPWRRNTTRSFPGGGGGSGGGGAVEGPHADNATEAAIQLRRRSSLTKAIAYVMRCQRLYRRSPGERSEPARRRRRGQANIVPWRATTKAVDESATTANRRWSLAAWGHIVDNDGDAKNTRATINGGPPRIA